MSLYDAFVSYSHAKDKPIAAALQSVVQKLGKPWYRRRALRVFRDDTSLSATPHLWPTIEQALGQSRFLMLLASPEAAASQWVDKEVAYWLAHKSADTLLIAVTDGALSWDNAASAFTWREDTPLPPALKGRFAAEPKWVDLTAYRDGADKGDAKFTELAADFAAAIRGMPKEDLLSQEVKQQRRALRLAFSAAALLLVLAVGATTAGILAYRAQQEAVAQRNRAEQTLAAATETADGLIIDLAQKFQNASGIPRTLVADILGRARDLQDQLSAYGGSSLALKRSKVAALTESSPTQVYAGDLNGALKSAELALVLMKELVAARPEDIVYKRDLSVAYERLGNAQRVTGKLDQAIDSFRQHLAIVEALAKEAPPSWDIEFDLANSYRQLGTILQDGKKTDEALALLEQARSALEKMLADYPNKASEIDIERISDWNDIARCLMDKRNLAGAIEAARRATSIYAQAAPDSMNVGKLRLVAGAAYRNLANLLFEQQQFDDAIESYQKAIDIVALMIHDDPQTLIWRFSLAVLQDDVGDVLQRQDKIEEAVQKHMAAVAILEELEKDDSFKAEPNYRLILPEIYQNLAKLFFQHDQPEQALQMAGKAFAIDRKRAETYAEDVVWQERILDDANAVGRLSLALGRRDDALNAYQLAASAAETVAQADGKDRARQEALFDADRKVADLLAALGRGSEALDAYREVVSVARAMADSDKDEVQWKRGQSIGYEGIGKALATQGNLDEALDAYLEGRAILLNLAENDRGDPQRQKDLANLDGGIAEIMAKLQADGSALRAQGKLEDALDAYRKCLAMSERLAAAAADNTTWRRNQVVSYVLIGDTLAAQGRLDDALAGYRKSLAILHELKNREPANGPWLRLLTIVHQVIGGVLAKSSELDGALAAYQKGLEAAEQLVAIDPTNEEGQRELAEAFRRVGDVLKAQNKPGEVLAAYRAAFTIQERLAAADPPNVQLQHELAVAYDDIADLQAEQGQLKDSLASYRGAMAIFQPLVEQDKDNEDWRRGLAYTISGIGGSAYRLVLGREFAMALEAADQAIALAPGETWIYVNRAHALMFLGRVDESRALYLQYRGTKNVLGAKSWEADVLEDFAELRQAGLTSPLMDEIEKQFTDGG